MRILIVLVVLVLGVGAVVVYRIGPRNIIGMLRYDQRREGSLQVGDRAPDVQLVALDGQPTVHLKDSVGERKPLVLIFGSFT